MSPPSTGSLTDRRSTLVPKHRRCAAVSFAAALAAAGCGDPGPRIVVQKPVPDAGDVAATPSPTPAPAPGSKEGAPPAMDDLASAAAPILRRLAEREALVSAEIAALDAALGDLQGAEGFDAAARRQVLLERARTLHERARELQAEGAAARDLALAIEAVHGPRRAR